MINIKELKEKTGKHIVVLDASAVRTSSCMLRIWHTVINGYRQKVMPNDVEYGSAFHLFVSEMKRNEGNMHLAMKEASSYWRNTPMFIKPKKTYLNETHLQMTCMQYWEYVGQNDPKDTLITENGSCYKCKGTGKVKKPLNIDASKPSESEIAINCDELQTDKMDCTRCNGTGVHAEPLVELKFCLKYKETDTVIILLAGTIDDICKWNEAYIIRDYKTTSVWDHDEYFRSYELSCQLMFYRFILNLYGQQYPDSVLATIAKGRVGAMIRGVFIKSGKDVPTFKDSQVFIYKDREMTEFKTLLDTLINRIIQMLDNKATPLREGMLNGACETVYGKCGFFSSCSAIDEIAGQHYLRHNFLQKPYDPLSFGEAH